MIWNGNQFVSLKTPVKLVYNLHQVFKTTGQHKHNESHWITGLGFGQAHKVCQWLFMFVSIGIERKPKTRHKRKVDKHGNLVNMNNK